jgi:hypothetical protein
MALTGLEREFLKRLFAEPWAKPAPVDHSLVTRLVMPATCRLIKKENDEGTRSKTITKDRD